MKIAIIEDEKLTAKDLAATILGIESDAEIVALLHSVEDAIAFFREKPQVDLIFSDIELGDGLSFTIFQTVSNQTPIVFCTAYQQYMLEAFKTTGIEYVLKPFNKLSIERTLIKYKTLQEKFSRPSSSLEEVLLALKGNLHQAEPSVIIHQADKIIPVKGSDIALFYIENECTFAYTFTQHRYLVNQKMDALSKTFTPSFFRVNRQFLVNRKAIKDVSHFFNRKLLLNLTLPFNEQLVVGKLRTTEFVDWLAAT